MKLDEKLTASRQRQTSRGVRRYARSLCEDDGATLDDLREAVTTFEDATRIGRRVLGAAHPTALGLGSCLEKSRAMLRAREAPPDSA